MILIVSSPQPDEWVSNYLIHRGAHRDILGFVFLSHSAFMWLGLELPAMFSLGWAQAKGSREVLLPSLLTQLYLEGGTIVLGGCWGFLKICSTINPMGCKNPTLNNARGPGNQEKRLWIASLVLNFKDYSDFCPGCVLEKSGSQNVCCSLFCPTSQGLFEPCVCILATGVPYTLGMEVCSLIQNTGKTGFYIWEVEDKTKKIQLWLRVWSEQSQLLYSQSGTVQAHSDSFLGLDLETEMGRLLLSR